MRTSGRTKTAKRSKGAGRGERFKAPSEDLLRAVADCEQDYLAFGSELRRVYERAMEVSKTSSSFAGLSEGERLKTFTAGLKTFLEQNSDLGKSSGRGTALLRSILEKAVEIESRLQTFPNVVRTMQVLCNLIKIESIRSRQGKAGFQALSEDVRGLAGNIEAKSAAITDGARALIQLVGKSLGKISGYELRRREKGKIISRNIIDGLRRLKERHDAAIETMDRISAAWEEVTSSIGEIVSSIQFHDITRQRIEHVAEALEEITALDDDNEAYEGLRLQRAQLLHTREELVSATERMAEELRKLGGRIGEISGEAGGVAAGAPEGGGSFFLELEKGVVDLTGAVEEHAEINRGMASTNEEVSDGVSRMECFAREIAKIGIEMKIIAINAAIYAAHVGEEGVALGVLAEHTHMLSQETTGQIASISENLQSVVDCANELKGETALQNRQRAEEETRVVEELKTMIPLLRQLDAEAMSMAGRTQEVGGSLSADIRKRSEEMRFHLPILKEIDSVAAMIEEECERIGGSLPKEGEHDGVHDVGRMEEMMKKYTMQKERDVHRLAVGATESGMESGADTERRQEGLGENVELF